jgi:hypothetical protein
MNARAWRPGVVTHGHDLVTVDESRDFRDCEAGENYWRTRKHGAPGGIRTPTLRFEV